MVEHKYHDGPSSKVLNKAYMRLRHRLQATIESTIGRQIHHYSALLNVLRSDPNPPNFYKWEFSMMYPSFPPKGISRWKMVDFQACEAALDGGHLKAVSVDPRHSGEDQHRASASANAIAQAGPSTPFPTGNFESGSVVQKSLATGYSGNHFASSGDHIQNGQSQASNMASPYVLAVNFQREMDKILEIALAKKEQEMSRLWKNESLVLSASLRGQLEEANREIETLQQRTRHLESNALKLRAVCRDNTNHTDGSSGSAKARDETIKEGAIAKRATSKVHKPAQVSTEVAPSTGQIRPQNVPTQETEIRPPTPRRSRLVVEIPSHSSPPSFSPGQELELNIIKENWGEHSLNTISTMMIAEIHTLCERLLHKLAKLSKKVNLDRASALLRDAIDHRNSSLAEDCRSSLLTSRDVTKALKAAAKLTKTSRKSSGPSSLPDSCMPDPSGGHGQRSNDHIDIDLERESSRFGVNSSDSNKSMFKSLPFRETRNIPPTSTPKTIFEHAFNKWTGPYASGAESFRFPTSRQRQELSSEILCRGNDSGMFGKHYRIGPPKARLKVFIGKIAQDLEDSFPIGLFDKEDNVIRMLALIAELFETHNQKELEQKNLPNDGAYKGYPAHANTSSFTDNGSSQSPGLKRARVGQSLQPVPKRLHLNCPTSTTPVRGHSISSQLAGSSPDDIIPHWKMMNLKGPVVNDNQKLAALQQEIMNLWPTPLARAWIFKVQHNLRFLEAVLPIAKTNSFENARMHVNCATITRLQHNNQGTPYATLGDFRILMMRAAFPFKISPEMLESMSLRKGPEGFLEKSNGDDVHPERLKSESVGNSNLYDASPARRFPVRRHNASPAFTPARTPSAPRVTTNLPATCTAKQVQDTLKRLIETYGTSYDNSCLMENAIGFKNEEIKEDFELMNHEYDVKNLDCFTDFLNTHYDDTSYRIGLFITKEKSSVWQTGTNSAQENWDIWVAITRRNLPGGETMLIIWDSNWGEKAKRHTTPRVNWAQHVLIVEVQKNHNLKSVWIGGTGNRARGNPLQLSIDFIHQIVRGGKVGNFPAGDVRSMKAAGYSELDYMRGIHANQHWLRPGTFENSPSVLNSHTRNRKSRHWGNPLGGAWTMGTEVFKNNLARKEALHDEQDSLYEPSVV